MNSQNSPTFLINTLGCKVNQYESQSMREELLENGFTESDSSDEAYFYIINSCTVTRKADHKTRNLAYRFHKNNPQGKIIVCGCLAETEGDRKLLMGIPGVARLIKNREKESVVRILHGMLGPGMSLFRDNAKHIARKKGITGFKNRSRAFIKIQDGCNHRCSYCKVSLVRGRSTSRPLPEVLEEAEMLVCKGYKEIVLTGICLGAWGKDLKVKKSLSCLTQRISQITGEFRIRLSSVEPLYVNEDLIRLLEENDKVCRHLHIPLQSGDDRILKLMKRPYSTKTFGNLVEKIRKHIPDVGFTTDILLGFPGEDERSFSRTLKYTREIKPSRIHAFSYSRREGTSACNFPDQTRKEVIKERVRVMTDMSERLSVVFAGRFMNKRLIALIENQRSKARWPISGYTDNYIRVFLENGRSYPACGLVPVRISRINEDGGAVFGRLDNRVII